MIDFFTLDDEVWNVIRWKKKTMTLNGQNPVYIMDLHDAEVLAISEKPFTRPQALDQYYRRG